MFLWFNRVTERFRCFGFQHSALVRRIRQPYAEAFLFYFLFHARSGSFSFHSNAFLLPSGYRTHDFECKKQFSNQTWTRYPRTGRAYQRDHCSGHVRAKCWSVRGKQEEKTVRRKLLIPMLHGCAFGAVGAELQHVRDFVMMIRDFSELAPRLKLQMALLSSLGVLAAGS